MTRPSAAGLVLSLLLAGCGGPPDGSPEAVCARQADRDPAVRDLLMKGAGSQEFMLDNQRRLHDARQDAALACLRARGLAPKGGVERPKRT